MNQLQTFAIQINQAGNISSDISIDHLIVIIEKGETKVLEEIMFDDLIAIQVDTDRIGCSDESSQRNSICVDVRMMEMERKWVFKDTMKFNQKNEKIMRKIPMKSLLPTNISKK